MPVYSRTAMNYLVREGRGHRLNAGLFYNRDHEDVIHPSFKIRGLHQIPSSKRVHTLETERISFTSFTQPWASLIELLEGLTGINREVSRDYESCTVENIAREDNENVTLYHAVLSTKDGVSIVCGSNRPRDNPLAQQSKVRLSDGSASQPGIKPVPWAWSDVMYSIWFYRVYPLDRFIHTQRNTESRQRILRGLRCIAFLGLDNPRALDIIRECYNKLNLDTESDTLAVSEQDTGVEAMVFDALSMAPGIHRANHMVFEHGKGLGHTYLKGITIRWPSRTEPDDPDQMYPSASMAQVATPGLPNVVLTLAPLALVRDLFELN